MRLGVRGLLLAVLVAMAVGCDEEPAVVGPAEPSSAISCLGVPSSKCDELVTQALKMLRVGAVRSIVVTCVTPTCTERSGKATVDIVEADGSTTGTGSGWDTVDAVGIPAPAPSG